MLRRNEVAYPTFLHGKPSRSRHDGPVMREVMQEADPLTVRAEMPIADVIAGTLAVSASANVLNV